MNLVSFELSTCSNLLFSYNTNFSGFWSRRPQADDKSSPSFLGGLTDLQIQNPTINSITLPKESFFPSKENLDYLEHILYETNIMENADLRRVLLEKAKKHRTYYESLVGSDFIDTMGSISPVQMALEVPGAEVKSSAFSSTVTIEESDPGSRKSRQRRRGVYEMDGTVDEPEAESKFRSVKQLREKYLGMLEKTYKHLSLDCSSSLDREKSELLVPPSSGYCSSSASGASDDEREKIWPTKKVSIRRSASSDSAVHSDEEGPVGERWGGEKKEEEIGAEACLRSPYSPRGSLDHSNVPSKTIIEAHYVPLPIDRKFSIDCASEVPSDTVGDSRRQSCFSEGDSEAPRYRYWRTPSVVVSDYSDDIMGLTLEDIEYIRSKRDASVSPDSSLHSSCSNLNYCGSAISGLDGDYVMSKPYRKSSNCSTCSTLSDEEDSPPSREATLQPLKNREFNESYDFRRVKAICI
ncbi:unnamed protein product [Phaedon cochleariae]|uniref:Uncharacterized protein n=1 Tax=Phaedon cochleariae TaxID=80249 RepID=A0A9N9SE96_PHACE|nr:unnamed protein product [Phaedon cochleariae]